MEYTVSRTIGEVEIFETFKGDINEIAELNKALASHKALMVKENEKSLADKINEASETATIQASNIEIDDDLVVKIAGENVGYIDTTLLGKALRDIQNLNENVKEGTE
ncbi:hypothetical protein [Lysinibacillus sp. RC79]|uniref:hypothetical protein n=1 Tax=Lysinibacillus sp. RC79 TaxID=3156296 RepID=UPI003516C762